MPEHAREVHGLVLREVERLVDGGVTDDELAIAVGYLTGAYEMGLEDTGARMSRLGGMLITTGAVRAVEDQLARWERVTLADTARVIANVYGAAAPITVAVGPGFAD
jgi:predicted Zn-dependent peptidase